MILSLNDGSEDRLSLLLRHATDLWHKLLASSQREPQEAELSVLLALLSHSPSDRVDTLLRRIAVLDRPAVAWVSALSRVLLATRPANSLTPQATGAMVTDSPGSLVPATEVDNMAPQGAGWHEALIDDAFVEDATELQAA
jgi:hypothetical protein